MGAAHWTLVIDPDREVALQALLAAAIKHSFILKEFLEQVVKTHYRTFKRQLSIGDLRLFLRECELRESVVASWSESTKKKVGQVIIRILAEAGYLESTRSMSLSPVSIHPKIREYLRENAMEDILHCMEIDR